MNKNISISLPEELWQEIDKLRGAVSRSAWVRGAVEFRLVADKSPATPLVIPESLKSKTRRQSGDTDTAPIVAEGHPSWCRCLTCRAPVRNKLKKPQKRRQSGDLDFDVWWDAYPKKIGKKAALDAWRRIPKQDRPAGVEVAKFIEEAKRTKRWREGFIPNPQTFVNQRRWEDDLGSYGPAVAPPRPPEEPLPMLTDTEGLLTWEALLSELQSGLRIGSSAHDLIDTLEPVAIEQDRPEQYYPVDVVVRAPNEHIRYMIEQEMAADGRRSIITAACEAANIGLRWEQPKRS